MRIIMDDKEVAQLVPDSLPILIHGVEGSGASMYTIALAAQWFKQGYKILFLCGYPMAEEEFTRLVGKHASAVFYTKDNVENFKKEVVDSDTIVIVKNIELFGADIVNSVTTKCLIVSGNLNKCSFKEELLTLTFVSEVYFSGLDDKSFPELKKYEGLVISGELKGITKLEQ